MRKKIIIPSTPRSIPEDEWLDLEQLATVELSSEAKGYPIEGALSAKGEGFCAAAPGPQIIRFVFDEPLKLRRIFLLFIEADRERSQEFVLRWSTDGEAFQEIVRQQWNFNPHNATHQKEDYRVALQDLRALELVINPDIQGETSDMSIARAPQAALATLAALRLA